LNPGLRFLLKTRLPGGFRRARRKYAGRDGRILILGVSLLVAGIAVLQATSSSFVPESRIPSIRPTAAGIRAYAPFVLLLVAMVGIRPGAFYFKAAEVQFLFPAPIPRRQLLAYNILSRLQIVFLSTLWVGLFTVRYAATWYGGILAIFGLLSFNQLTAQLGGVWLAGFDPSPAARRRRWTGIALAGAALVAGFLATSSRTPTGIVDAATMLVAHPFAWALTAVTRPFVELFLAAGPADLLLHGGVAAAILGLEVLALIRVDQSHLERLAGAGGARGRSRKLRLARHRDPGDSVRNGSGLRIPGRLFPHWAGAGPLAWRQAQELARHPATLLRGGLGLFAVLPVLLFRLSSAGQDAAGLAAGSLTTALLMIPMMFDGADFRRDLDRMSVLRSLPLSAPALVMGQLIPTSIVIAGWMWIGSLMILAIIDLWSTPILYLVAMTIPPFALMTTAIDNWLFLLMPYRIRSQDPGETTFVGRLTVVMSIKALVIVAAFGVSVAATFAFFTWVVPSTVLAGVVACAMLSVCCIPMIWGVTRTFQRFDVARHAAE